MGVKIKISKSKRNNQKKNKLVKQGLIKKSKKPNKQVKERQILPEVSKNKQVENDSESDNGEDMLQMIDEDDVEFLKNAVSNHSYGIFNKIKYSEFTNPKSKKRKLHDEDDSLENKYEEHNVDINSNKKIKTLLPIKTKAGVIPQQIVEETNEETEKIENYENSKNVTDGEELNGKVEFSIVDSELDLSKPVSATQLLVTRNDILRQRKIHIGTLSSGVLENPEEKVMNLRTLLKIMTEDTPEIYLTVKKLVIVSLLEVFRDILPSYEIKNVKQEGVKLKKDTLKLQKYEDTLLLYYKKYLQKLEQYMYLIKKKKGHSIKPTEDEIKLSTIAAQAMCDLLVAHPYFNFSHNIAQAIVPFLSSRNKNIREIVKSSIKTIFKEDKKEEMTLKILRVINNYLKNHLHNVHSDMLDVLLVLNLKNVNLDQGKEQDLKQKKLMAHKSKILQMSKKERKRKKRLKEVEKEILETKAEENKQAKQKNLTEITKIVFNIYFRILKNSSNSKVLGVCLEGLAKFAHCLNLEFYVDIVNVLDSLLKEEWIGYKEKLHSIQTVFAILSDQGELLNLDPTRFYNSLYKDLLTTNATSKTPDHILPLLKTLNDALIKRRKRNTNNRTISFVKRLATLSLQLLHDGNVGCLAIIKNAMQLNRLIDILLDLDSSVGDGKFQPEINDPEYANASSTALYEMVLLARHYHPIVKKFAVNIVNGAPATGEGSLPGEYGKCSAEQLYSDFCMSDMAFNPPVPVPKKVQPKSKPRRLQFIDSSFKQQCKDILKGSRERKHLFWISEFLHSALDQARSVSLTNLLKETKHVLDPVLNLKTRPIFFT